MPARDEKEEEKSEDVVPASEERGLGVCEDCPTTAIMTPGASSVALLLLLAVHTEAGRALYFTPSPSTEYYSTQTCHPCRCQYRVYEAFCCMLPCCCCLFCFLTTGCATASTSTILTTVAPLLLPPCSGQQSSVSLLVSCVRVIC